MGSLREVLVSIGGELHFGRYRLHPADGLCRGRRQVRLTPKSLALLRVLAERGGHVVSKGEIFREVWPDTAVSDAALTSCIQELRRAFRDDARRPRFIETVHRRGYRFVAGIVTGAAGRLPARLDAANGLAPAPAAAGSLPGVPSAAPSPFVGRSAALAQLRGRLAKAMDGERQLVLVTGGPGTGKTTLVRTFLAGIPADTLRIAWGQSVERAGAGEPYGPLLDALTRLCRQPGGEEVIARLQQCAPTWLAQLPSLQTPAQAAALARRTAGVTRDRMQRELIDAIEALAVHAPLVLWIEDLHWGDVSTTDWLASFACRPDPARVLLILTLRRPELPASASPLESILAVLQREGRGLDLALPGLGVDEVRELVWLRHPPARGAEGDLARVADAVHARSGGTPLFVTAVLDDLAARGHLRRHADGWRAHGSSANALEGVPDTVACVIERQLSRLDPDHRSLLEVASVLGLEWSSAIVAAAALREQGEVESPLHRLAREAQVIRPSVTHAWPDGPAAAFSFVHALYRDVLREHVPAGRRADIHRRAGIRLEEAYGADAAQVAAELATHFEEGRELGKAIRYLTHAGATAHHRRAYPEAEMYLARAVDLIGNLPPSAERDALEAAVRITWGPILMATRGWGDARVEETYRRARVLLHALPASRERFPALWGLWLFYWGRASLAVARELAAELAVLASRADNPDHLLQAEHAAWATAFSLGEPERAYRHAARGIELYDERQHAGLAARYGDHDAGVCARMFAARALALMGRSADAARLADEAIALARALGHPVSGCLALVFASSVYQVLGDAPAARAAAVEAVAIADEYGLRLIGAWAHALEGWASEVNGRDARQAIRRAIMAARATGSDQFQPYMLGLLADVHLRLGERDEGLQVVREALAIAERTGERFYEAELHRLHGALLLANGEEGWREPAQAAFERSIATATRQGALLLATRAADALARLAADARPQERSSRAHECPRTGSQ